MDLTPVPPTPGTLAHTAGSAPTRQDGERRWLRRATTLVALIAVAYAAWLTLVPAPRELILAGDGALQILLPLAGVWLCLVAGAGCHAAPVRTWSRRPIRRWLPALVAGGLLANALGQALGLAESLQPAAAPFPTWSDAAFLPAYPLFLAGVLLLPERPLPAALRARVVLDGIVIVLALTMCGWVTLLGPLVLRARLSPLGTAVALSYPLCDLLVLTCLLLLWMYADHRNTRGALILYSVALIGVAVSDCLAEYQLLRGTYAPGTLTDVVPALSSVLAGLGTVLLRRHPHVADVDQEQHAAMPESDRSVAQHLWRAALPYCAIPVVALLAFSSWRYDGDERIMAGVAIGGPLLALVVFLRQLMAILENAQLNRQLQEKNVALAASNARLAALASTDPLTALPNQRAAIESADRELARAVRYGRPLAVLFIDVDHFKALNDTYGHPAGDAALCGFAALVRSLLRAADSIGRWGGEEFVAVLADTDLDGAIACAESIREAVQACRFDVASGLQLTCSIGVSAYPEDGGSRAALLGAADRAMYAAKRLGRNQVRWAGHPAARAVLDGATPATRHEEQMLHHIRPGYSMGFPAPAHAAPPVVSGGDGAATLGLGHDASVEREHTLLPGQMHGLHA